jgi:hypothetical protein
MDFKAFEASIGADRRGEITRGPDRRLAEVDAGHDRARPRPGEGVESEVALEM